jgi:large subunit ribosomal protein L17
MRHGKKVNHLSRQTGHRKSMLANMACSLIEHKRINTTVAKAKALKQFVEPLITKSKEDTTHNRRIVFAYLRNKYGVTELFREVAAKVGDRPGGYTRIIKVGNRLGDNADMAMIELVDFNELYKLKKLKLLLQKQKLQKLLQKKLLIKQNNEFNFINIKDKLFLVYPFFYVPLVNKYSVRLRSEWVGLYQQSMFLLSAVSLLF